MSPRAHPLSTLLASFWLVAVALLLTGCASPPNRPITTDPSTYWSGRLSLRIDSDPPQQFSAGFELLGTADQGELHLISPLGQTFASTHWTPQFATLKRGEQQRHYPDLERLTTDLTGTPLPVAALFDWLHGHHRNADGWTADLSQQPHGRISAYRSHPAPSAQLRLVLE